MVQIEGPIDYSQITGPVFILISDSTVNFTGAIAANAIGTENITGLKSNTIRIVGLTIESTQNLDYDILFWSSANNVNSTTLNKDTLLGQELLNITTNGFQIAAANQFYMTLEGLRIDYVDNDSTSTLHVSLRPRTAGGKAAGAGGAVLIKIRYVVTGS